MPNDSSFGGEWLTIILPQNSVLASGRCRTRRVEAATPAAAASQRFTHLGSEAGDKCLVSSLEGGDGAYTWVFEAEVPTTSIVARMV